MSVGRFVCSSPSQSQTLGMQLGRLLQTGDVVLLHGAMGAGKTVLVKGIAQALDIAEPITSPTFVLIRSYHGPRHTLHHGDLWRLDKREEVLSLGLDELVESDGILILEWGERAAELINVESLSVFIVSNPDEPDVRIFNVVANSKSWSERVDQLLATSGEIGLLNVVLTDDEPQASGADMARKSSES